MRCKTCSCHARYEGNMGIMEMFRFYEVATKPQKEHMEMLLTTKQYPEAWDYLQEITGLTLEPVDWGESTVRRWFRHLVKRFRSTP